MAISLLCEIIAQRGKALAATFRHQAGYSDLIRAGLVGEAGVAQSVVCDDCENPHDAEIVFEDGQYGYYCPDLGLIALERNEIVAVEPNIGRLVDALARAFDCRSRNSKPIHGATWRVGVIDTDQGGVAVYFHPCLQGGNDLREFESALLREVASPFTVVLTACGSLVAPGNRMVNLADVVDLDPATSAIMATFNLCIIVGIQTKRSAGAPEQFGSGLRSIFAEHLRTSGAFSNSNKEARDFIRKYKAKFPSSDTPSMTTVKRHRQKFTPGP